MKRDLSTQSVHVYASCWLLVKSILVIQLLSSHPSALNVHQLTANPEQAGDSKGQIPP